MSLGAKKRSLWMLISLAILILVGLSAWQLLNLQKKSQVTGSLVLDDLPTSYCPKEAQVVLRIAGENQNLTDQTVSLADCHTIALSPLLAGHNGSLKIWVRLPQALAFSRDFNWPLTQDLTYAPRLGDSNGDNVVDGADEQAVSAQIFAANDTNVGSADIDGDGRVTVLDLSLVKLNQGVGAARPDGKAWQAF
ncbi:MAG TPA: dockerin type I domain-containing protein [Candidatus Saccharimonadales bacterium]|nr:dockerin type I domain-containing protein [Candidatus Saccharimonadales bacterium]